MYEWRSSTYQGKPDFPEPDGEFLRRTTVSKGMLGKLPLSAVRGPRDALEERLAGQHGPMWLGALNRFLRRENPWPDFRIWRTVKVGLYGKPYTRGDEYCQVLTEEGFRPDEAVKKALACIEYSDKILEFDLVLVTGKDLDVPPEGMSFSDFCSVALEQGLQPCHPEVGPALFSSMGDQVLGGLEKPILVISEWICGTSFGCRVGYGMFVGGIHNQKPSIDLYWPEGNMKGLGHYVFVKPRPKT